MRTGTVNIYSSAGVYYSYDSKSEMPLHRYGWLHLPTGKRGVTEIHTSSIGLLVLMKYWNSSSPENWVYFPLR